MSGKLAGAERDQTLVALRQARQKLSQTIEQLKSGKAPKGYYNQGENILSEMDQIIQ